LDKGLAVKFNIKKLKSGLRNGLITHRSTVSATTSQMNQLEYFSTTPQKLYSILMASLLTTWKEESAIVRTSEKNTL
jgi:hypothetical protein